VGARLIGDYVDLDSTAHDFRKDFGAVADKTNGQGTTLAARGFAEGKGFVEVFAECVAIARVDSALDARAVNINGEEDAAIHRDRERLRSAHATHAAGDDELPRECTSEVALPERGKGLECAL
jgi:hypothetical protein